MALYDTVNQILSDVAVEVGLAAPADPWASIDPNFVQLRALLKSAGRSLVKRCAWLQCQKEYSFATTGAATYDLPADFVEMLDQTGWNRTQRRPMDVASPQEWQYLVARNAGAVFTALFRPLDGKIEVWPTTSSGETIALEYRSRYWVAVSASADPTLDAPTDGDDVVKLDTHLVSRLLKLRWLQAKGFDTAAALDEFNEAFDDSRRQNAAAAPTLSLNGDATLAERMIDLSNLPATGYGFDGEGGLF